MNSSDEITHARRVFSEMLKQGVQIKMYWDAGGDETPVWVTYDGAYMKTDEAAESVMRYELIRKLSLPNAGEEYNAGSGDLFLSPEGAIGVRYAAYDHEYGMTEIPGVETTEDDPFNFHQHVNSDTHLMFRSYNTYFTGMRNDVFSFFDKGKQVNVPVAPEAKAYYTSLFDRYLAAHGDRAGKAVGSDGLEIITDVQIDLSFKTPQRVLVCVGFSTSSIVNATKDELILL